MTCSDVERALPELLDGAGEGAFPTDVENHVKSCPACSDLISDLETIAGQARHLASEDPPPRVWARIEAELRAEGLIHNPESLPRRPVLVPTTRRQRWNGWSAWWLAPVAAALLAAGAYTVSHRPATPSAQLQAPATPAPLASAASATAPSTSVPSTTVVSSPSTASPKPAPAPIVASAAATAPQHLTQKPATAAGQPTAEATETVQAAAEPEPKPSAEDQQFLSVVSTRAPSMRATYETQLQAVNADIQETQAYVNRNPGDTDARQHLMDAYQQKALLYQIALDRIQ